MEAAARGRFDLSLLRAYVPMGDKQAAAAARGAGRAAAAAEAGGGHFSLPASSTSELFSHYVFPSHYITKEHDFFLSYKNIIKISEAYHVKDIAIKLLLMFRDHPITTSRLARYIRSADGPSGIKSWLRAFGL